MIREFLVRLMLAVLRRRFLGKAVVLAETDEVVVCRGIVTQPEAGGNIFLLKCYSTHAPVFGREPVKVWNLDIRGIKTKGGAVTFRPIDQ